MQLKQLRPFQQQANWQMNTLLNAGRSPVFLSATGTGKTTTISSVIKDRISIGKRVYLLAPTIETFGQWLSELFDCGLNPGTIDGDGIKGRNRSVYVCMYISLFNLLPYIDERLYPDEIAIDEMHHFRTNTIEAIKEYFTRANWFGCTATLVRLDGKGFDYYFTDIVQTITMQEAIEQGYLAKPIVIVPEKYFDKVEIISGEYDKAKQIELLGKTQIIGSVIESYAHVFNGLPVIVACCSHEHAASMTAAFCAAGWDFKHIYGNLPKHDRAKMIRDTKAARINGLCTYSVGTEGADIVGLYGVIWLRRTTSLVVWMQFCGRCLRPMEGKEYGIILDPVGNLFIHGFPEAERVWTLEGSVQSDSAQELAPTMRICPNCGVANSTQNAICHFCGWGLYDSSGRPVGANKRHLPAIIDGNLIAVTSDGMAEALYSKRGEAHGPSISRQTGLESVDNKQVSEASGSPILTSIDKRAILRRGLFDGKRPLFEEAVRGIK